MIKDVIMRDIQEDGDTGVTPRFSSVLRVSDLGRFVVCMTITFEA